MDAPESLFDGRVPPPDFVAIETTKYCNLSCEMCLQFQDGTTVTGPHMPIEDFERWADEIFPFVTRFQPSVSGEPLLSKGFAQMLRKAGEYGVQLEVTCNGTLLNDRMRADLIPVLGKITISFDGGTKEIFEAMREGSKFETVRDRVRALCEEVHRLPEGRRPIVDLLCVLRRLNIRDVVNVVEVAHEIGVDMLHFTHMYPPTEELKSESLVHDREVAIEYIDRALARAKELGLTLTVQPLDQLTAASATSGGQRRKYATENGSVGGLGAKSVDAGGWPTWPQPFPEDDPEHDAIQARRETAWAKTSHVRRAEPEPAQAPAPARGFLDKIRRKAPATPESIWFCDYLWNKTYIGVSGHVTPCCVPAAPQLGDLAQQRFDDVWNSPRYRDMRLRMALKKPVPFCRGCQHIQEIHEPEKILRALGGRELPSADTLVSADGPPEFTWMEARNARGYEIEFSLNGFADVDYSSSWHGPMLTDNRFRVPQWVWEQTPKGQAVYWRAFAHLAAENGSASTRFEVGQGVIPAS
jgi:MoaA/NifB/PqqE/SkfB family radical SAM enzyme